MTEIQDNPACPHGTPQIQGGLHTPTLLLLFQEFAFWTFDIASDLGFRASDFLTFTRPVAHRTDYCVQAAVVDFAD
jgi:hypothetical protein